MRLPNKLTTTEDISPEDTPFPGSTISEFCAATIFFLSLLGDKWSVRVIARLGKAPVRFNEMKRSIPGISQRMLTTTLRSLQREGLVLRIAHPGKPPAVEYHLSDLGRSLWTVVQPLCQWTAEHLDDVNAARERFKKGL